MTATALPGRTPHCVHRADEALAVARNLPAMAHPADHVMQQAIRALQAISVDV